MKINDVLIWGGIAVGLYVLYVVLRPIQEGEGLIGEPSAEDIRIAGEDEADALAGAQEARITLV